MRMSAVARHYNFMPKENSKTQQKKREMAKDNYRPKICCEKCKKTNLALYRVSNNKYMCKNCISKEEKKSENN